MHALENKIKVGDEFQVKEASLYGFILLVVERVRSQLLREAQIGRQRRAGAVVGAGGAASAWQRQAQVTRYFEMGRPHVIRRTQAARYGVQGRILSNRTSLSPLASNG